VRGAGPAPPVNVPSAAQTPAVPQTAADYFDAAKLYYQQGRLAEAEIITRRALDLLRAAIPATPTVAAAPPSPGGPVRVGGDIKEPRKIRHVNPIYPADALAAGVEGIVILEATVARNGTVRDAMVLRSVPMLDEAALAAVRQWLFTPTLLNGVPIDVVMTVTVTFSAR
jgi:TonB family protein